MTELQYTDSIVVACPPEAVYDLVSDVTRTGEWSPICTGCWWDEGDGPRAGAWFTGRNETPERTWETRSQVETADLGRAFGWLVGGSLVRWAYTFAPAEAGTLLTESWEFLPDGLAHFEKRFGDDATAEIDVRARAAHSSIPVTLAAIKRVAEAER